MKQGTIDLLNSERGALCVLLVLASAIFVIVGKLPVADWIKYTQVIAVTLVASKTVTGAIETMTPATPTPSATT